MEPITTAALISGGASLLGGLFGRSGVSSQNAANAKQAQLNRDFQERMSSTSHQRAVTDLRAAGLNPILSATKGGASTPSGAQAQMQSELEPIANSAQQTAQILAQMQLVKAQTRKTNQEANILGPKAAVYGRLEKIIDSILPSDATSAKDVLDVATQKIKAKGNEYAKGNTKEPMQIRITKGANQK